MEDASIDLASGCASDTNGTDSHRQQHLPDTTSTMDHRFTPAGLLPFLYYQHGRDISQGDNNREPHPHEFIACPVEENNYAPFVCQICHLRLMVKSSSPSSTTECQTACTVWPTHHFHMDPPSRFECCGCRYTIDVTTRDPVLKAETINQLTEDRPLHHGPSESTAARPTTPSLVDTLTLVLTYVKNLLGGDGRSINSKNPHFQSRIGLDAGSKAIMTGIGYTFNAETGHFDVPPVQDRDKLLTIRDELLVCLYTLQAQIGAESTGLSKVLGAVGRAMPRLQDIIGVDRTKERLMPYAEPGEDDQPELYLGSVPEATDSLLIWLYHRLVQESPDKAHIYMDLLVKEARMRKSDPLWTEVSLESNKEQPSDVQVKQAYIHFGIDPDSQDIDDLREGTLMDMYDTKVRDDPEHVAHHCRCLQIIANARKSQVLFEHLKRTDLSAAEQERDTVSVPPPPPPPRTEGPVGLNNIGNTCYLNSLLQYYNTLVPLRETIVQMDDNVEDETAPDWTPKKIGGIEVDQKEVRRAKKFVSYLRDLFINLKNSNARAISPTYDLAYMALLNGKDIEELDKKTDEQPQSAEQNGEKQQQPEHQENGKVENESVTPEESMQTSKPHEEESDRSQDEQETIQPAEDTQDSNNQKMGGQMHQPEPDRLPTDEQPQSAESVSAPVSNSATKGSSDDDNMSVVDDDKHIPINEAPPSYDQVVKEKGGTESGDLPTCEKAPELPARRPSAANMMLGKQQDVTECMSNVMFLIEAALKPLEKKNEEQTRDIVRDLFYFKARQILTYEDTHTLREVRKIQQEEFAHVMVDAAEGKDLYGGLDEYFFAGHVENFHGGRKATREVTVSTFPPVFQIQVQRVQFDRETSNVYKSNAFIKLEKVIYLDRYSESNFEALAGRRREVAEWQKQIESNNETIRQLAENKAYPMPIPQMLEATAAILEEYRSEEDEQLAQMHEQALQLLKDEASQARDTIEKSKDVIANLRQRIRAQYEDLTDIAYRLHAVFIHQGQANYGHYWVYIYNHEQQQWWKYNDSFVTKAEESEIFQNTTGRTANPYFVVYIKESEAERLVDLGASKTDKADEEATPMQT